jgi:hypothetical protein
MKIEIPSNTSAAIAGVWTAAGMPILPWLDAFVPKHSQLLFFVWAIPFFWVPIFRYVFGGIRGEPMGAALRIAFTRGFSWFIAGSVTMTLLVLARLL